MVNFNELKITKDSKHFIIDVSVKNQTYYDDVYIDEILIDTQNTYKDNGPSSKAMSVFKAASQEIRELHDYRCEATSNHFILPEEYLNTTISGIFTLKDNEAALDDGHLYKHPYKLKIGDMSVTGTQDRYKDIVFSIPSCQYTGDIIVTAIDNETNAEVNAVENLTMSAGIDLIADISAVLGQAENLKNVRLELTNFDVPNLNTNLFFIYVKVKGTPSPDTPCGMDNEYTIGVTFNTCTLYNAMMQHIKELLNICSIPKNFINLFLQFKAIQISINTQHYTQAIDYYNKFIKNLNTLTSTHIKSCNCYG